MGCHDITYEPTDHKDVQTLVVNFALSLNQTGYILVKHLVD